jgi:tripartite-type tricarboxylate transporter receptor subunit TctC
MKSLLRRAVLLCVLLSGCAQAWAQTYPNKSVRLVVGFAPGGATDVTARIVAQKLTELWAQTVIVDNRPGASGIIAADVVAKAAPDGYMLLGAPQTSTSVAATLYPKLPYDVLRDLAIITVLGSSPQLLVIHPSLPPKTFQEFVPFAKANYRSLSF